MQDNNHPVFNKIYLVYLVKGDDDYSVLNGKQVLRLYLMCRQCLLLSHRDGKDAMQGMRLPEEHFKQLLSLSRDKLNC